MTYNTEYLQVLLDIIKLLVHPPDDLCKHVILIYLVDVVYTCVVNYD